MLFKYDVTMPLRANALSSALRQTLADVLIDTLDRYNEINPIVPDQPGMGIQTLIHVLSDQEIQMIKEGIHSLEFDNNPAYQRIMRILDKHAEMPVIAGDGSE